MKRSLSLALLALLLTTSPLRGAQEPLSISGAWARATPPGATTGAVYMTIANQSGEEIALMQVTTPRAEGAEIHRTAMEGGMMRMAAIAGLVIPAGEEVALAPGGLHIMLTGLDGALAAGERFPLTLKILGGGATTTEVQVMAPGEMHDH